MPKTTIFSLKKMHHHGGQALKLVRQGECVAFYNERRCLVEAILRPPTAEESARIMAQLQAEEANE